MFVHKCDKCKVLIEGKLGHELIEPTGWCTLRIGNYPTCRLVYHLCPECRIILKIPKTFPAEDVGVRLLDLITELAEEAVGAAIDNH